MKLRFIVLRGEKQLTSEDLFLNYKQSHQNFCGPMRNTRLRNTKITEFIRLTNKSKKCCQAQCRLILFQIFQLPTKENWPFLWEVQVQNLNIIDYLNQDFFLSDLN